MAHVRTPGQMLNERPKDWVRQLKTHYNPTLPSTWRKRDTRDVVATTFMFADTAECGPPYGKKGRKPKLKILVLGKAQKNIFGM